MAYVSISDFIASRGSNSYKTVVLILQNALNTLKSHHSSGKVYGALIPSNLSVNPNENYKVELRQGVDPILLPDDLSSLNMDDLLGLSPENFSQNQGLDHRSDLYGLGYIAYYLLTGEANPYKAETAADLSEKIKLGSLPDPSQGNPDVPEWLAKIVQKLTAPDQSQRYQSVFSLIRNIESGLASEPKLAAAPAIPEPMATVPEAPKTPSVTPISDFNPYQPISRDKPLKSAQGIVIKGLFAGLGVVIVVVSLLLFLPKKPKGLESPSSIEAENAAIQYFVLVVGGEFMMGSNDSQEDDERPVHEVYVSSFYMAKAELTQKEWTALMGNNPSNVMGDDLPVSQVSWLGAVEYCNKRSVSENLEPCYSINGRTNPTDWSSGVVECNWQATGYRLPTEAEWEFAAKGGKQSRNYIYCGSNVVSEVSWTSSNSNKRLQPVKMLQPNELGLYDMGANIEEWCWDWYNPGYYQSSEYRNPLGPAPTEDRVLRGGSWKYADRFSKAGNRAYDFPWKGSLTNGLRLCRSANNDANPEKTMDRPAIQTSSMKPKYPGSYIMDANEKTAWSAALSGDGAGEYVLFTWDHKVNLSSLSIIPGYNKNEEIWYNNNRLKEIKIEFSDATAKTQNFDGDTRNHVIKVDKIGITWVRISVISTYPGQRWLDTCISEIGFQEK